LRKKIKGEKMASLFRSIRKLGGVLSETVDAVASGAETVVTGAKDVVPVLSNTGSNLIRGIVYGAKIINEASEIAKELAADEKIVGLKAIIATLDDEGLIDLINKAHSKPDSKTGQAYKLLKERYKLMDLTLTLAEKEVEKFMSKDYKTIKDYNRDLKKLKESLSSLEITLIHKLKSMIDGE
jgi:hypothetical protein